MRVSLVWGEIAFLGHKEFADVLSCVYLACEGVEGGWRLRRFVAFRFPWVNKDYIVISGLVEL